MVHRQRPSAEARALESDARRRKSRKPRSRSAMRAPSLDMDTQNGRGPDTSATEAAQSPFPPEDTHSGAMFDPGAPPPLPRDSGGRPKLAIVARNSTSDVKKGQKAAPKTDLKGELNRASNRELHREIREVNEGSGGKHSIDFSGNEATADHVPDDPRLALPPATPPKGTKTAKPKTDPRAESSLFVWSDAGMVPKPAPKQDAPKQEVPKRTAKGVSAAPPTEAVERPPRYRLRRSESVIAEAVAEKNGIWKMEQMARRASTQVAGILSNGIAAASMIGDYSARGVKHFESLPRRKQIMWVAAPYAVVILLVLVLVELRQPSSAAATVIAPVPQTVQPAQPKDQILIQQPHLAPAIVMVQPAQKPAPTPAPVVEEKIEAPKPSPVDQLLAKSAVTSPAKDAKASKADDADMSNPEWRTLPINASLRVKPDAKAVKVVKMKAGTRVMVYPDFSTRAGWVFAQSPDGEVGFLKKSSLEGKTSAPVKKATRVRPAKSGKTKADPFKELQRPRKRKSADV